MLARERGLEPSSLDSRGAYRGIRVRGTWMESGLLVQSFLENDGPGAATIRPSDNVFPPLPPTHDTAAGRTMARLHPCHKGSVYVTSDVEGPTG